MADGLRSLIVHTWPRWCQMDRGVKYDKHLTDRVRSAIRLPRAHLFRVDYIRLFRQPFPSIRR